MREGVLNGWIQDTFPSMGSDDGFEVGIKKKKETRVISGLAMIEGLLVHKTLTFTYIISFKIHKDLASQSVTRRRASSTSPGSLLEIQNLRLTLDLE